MTDARGAQKEMMLYYKEMVAKKKEKNKSNRETQQILPYRSWNCSKGTALAL